MVNDCFAKQPNAIIAKVPKLATSLFKKSYLGREKVKNDFEKSVLLKFH